MRKMLFIFGILISIVTLPAEAEQIKQEVTVNHGSLTNPTIGTRPHRTIMLLPSVELVYDTETSSISIVCSYDCDAEVTVYDATGNILAVSDIKDTIFVPSIDSSYFSVTIEAEYWYGATEIRR